jgi:hypothetical protein
MRVLVLAVLAACLSSAAAFVAASATSLKMSSAEDLYIVGAGYLGYVSIACNALLIYIFTELMHCLSAWQQRY